MRLVHVWLAVLAVAPGCIGLDLQRARTVGRGKLQASVAAGVASPVPTGLLLAGVTYGVFDALDVRARVALGGLTHPPMLGVEAGLKWQLPGDPGGPLATAVALDVGIFNLLELPLAGFTPRLSVPTGYRFQSGLELILTPRVAIVDGVPSAGLSTGAVIPMCSWASVAFEVGGTLFKDGSAIGPLVFMGGVGLLFGDSGGANNWKPDPVPASDQPMTDW